MKAPWLSKYVFMDRTFLATSCVVLPPPENFHLAARLTNSIPLASKLFRKVCRAILELTCPPSPKNSLLGTQHWQWLFATVGIFCPLRRFSSATNCTIRRPSSNRDSGQPAITWGTTHQQMKLIVAMCRPAIAANGSFATWVPSAATVSAYFFNCLLLFSFREGTKLTRESCGSQIPSWNMDQGFFGTPFPWGPRSLLGIQ